MRVINIEDPVKAQDGVDDHGCIVGPGRLVAEDVTKERF